MDDTQFWTLLKSINWRKLGDDDAVVEPLVKKLARLSEDEIRSFEDTLAEKLYHLDTRAHCDSCGESADSSDLFLYTRAAVVANGQDVYEALLADPHQMPTDAEFEALLYVSATAYQSKTGQEFDHATKFNYETGSNTVGWPKA